jgi:hypothetical protein
MDRRAPILPFVDSFLNFRALDVVIQEYIVKHLVAYILHITTFNDLKLAISKYFPNARQLSALRKYCINSWDINVALRMAIYSCIATKANNEQALRIFQQWGLSSNYLIIYESLPVWGYQTKLRKLVRELQQPIPKPQQLVDNCTLLMDSDNITVFIKKFVYRKLRTFAANNRLSLADFEQDLLAKGTQCYYSAVPNLSMQHTVNNVKKSIKHHGHSLISYYTAECRSRLVKWDTASGVTNTLRTLDGLSDNDINCNPMYASLTELNTMDLWLNYQRLLDRAEGSKRKALSMMLLENNDQFCQWFNFYYHRDCDTTRDVYLEHPTPTAYFDTIRAYLGIPSQRFNYWLQTLSGN